MQANKRHQGGIAPGLSRPFQVVLEGRLSIDHDMFDTWI